ncbi:cellulose biosynthesis cyclic di-GMP-binding regulatory protein BcsB [Gallaecimonas sp. GXIMD1310]|uniref:cellulose biosynthesis cyclic di-GMP-binding regulatory protein BcsB n=1 Tax=Gallaecimonas sp. GXIMD1310 TaxID=3131926 RepID=UPI00325235D1
MVLALALSVVASRAWAEPLTYKEHISLHEAGVNGDMTILANGANNGVHFSLRKDELVTAATLALDVRYPGASFPKDSYLDVMLNGQALKSIPLDPFGADGQTVKITIPPALVVSQNDLNFRIQGQQNATCHREKADPNRVLIADSSALSLSLERLPRPSTLAMFPAPFFDQGIMGSVTVPMVLPADASNSQLQSAALVASYFGKLAAFRGARFPVSRHDLPNADAIAFVTGAQLLGMQLPAPTGPQLRIINNPVAPQYKLLLVMGRTDAEVAEAARYLVTKSDKLSGQQMAVSTVTLIPRQPFDAPNWVGTDKPVQLGALADSNALIARGINHGANDVNFRAAPDLLLWRNRGVPLHVRYLFPEGDWLDEGRSTLNVSLNGQYLTSLPVNNRGIGATIMGWLGNDIRQQEATVELPSYLLYGENKLQFYFDLRLHPRSDCDQVPANGVLSRILPSSTLDMGQARHFTKLPNLSYFVGAGFPFSRYADLSQTTALLPAKPTATELSTLLALVGRIGAATGYPAYGLQVQQGLTLSADLVDRDVLVVSTLARLAASSVLQSSPFVARQSHLSLKNTSWTERWKRLFSGDWTRQGKAARRVLESQEHFEGLLSFLSPLNSKRTVVVASASDDQQLASMLGDLDQPKASSEIHGDLVLLGPQQVRSYRVGPVTGVGDLPWDMRVRWYFGQHVLQLLAILLLGILLGASLIYPFLRAHARRRLPDGEQKHDQ